MTLSNVIVGDVGGTNCRFALAQKNNQGSIELSNTIRLSVSDYASFYEALEDYLSSIPNRPKHAAFALAGPRFNGVVQMTNVDWKVSEQDLRQRFDFDVAVVANDFAAMARGAALIPDDGFDSLIDGKVNYSEPVAVLGPGTGLGVACILPGKPVRILSSEGGHAAFAPQDDLQIEVLKTLLSTRDFVSTEHLLSGPGLLRLYQTICKIYGENPIATKPDEVVAAAEASTKSSARKTVVSFCDILGGFSGNVAHILGASGGVIIAGGVSRHIAPFIGESNFATRFGSRGKGAWFSQNIAVRLLHAHFVALYGAAALLEDRKL